jgi:hypothetical protein
LQTPLSRATIRCRHDPETDNLSEVWNEKLKDTLERINISNFSRKMMSVFVENRKVLYVDDEPALLDAFTSLMRKESLKITTLQMPKILNRF